MATALTNVSIRPVTPERLDDLAALFGTSKTTMGCHCMWFLMPAKECEAGWSGGNRRAFAALAGVSSEPLGVLAYRGLEAVGWCAAGPRTRYARALRSPILKGRDDAADLGISVVSITEIP